MKSYKKLITLLSLVAIVFISLAAFKEPAAGPFKNLKVLPKYISEDSLDKIMDGFNAAMGVDCKFCHTQNKTTTLMEFEKDSKAEKEIARNMMRMTADINKKYFYFNETAGAQAVQAVTCYTCHKGGVIPAKENKPENKDLLNFKSNSN